MNLKEQLQHQIKLKGGWVNTHAHFDRAFSLDKDSINHIYSPLKEKWSLVDKLKKESSVEDIFLRMEKATILMDIQGCQAIGSFIDVDEAIEDKAILATVMRQATEKILGKNCIDIRIDFKVYSHEDLWIEEEAQEEWKKISKHLK